MKAILTFHSLDDRGSVLSFSPGKFERLVQGLLQQGIAICSLDELLAKRTGNAVALTFDDGMQSIHAAALPVLRDAAVPAHLYLTTGWVGRDNRWPTQPKSGPRMELLSWDQVQDCAEAGMLVESHTVNHPDLRALEEAQVELECERADEEIERRIGRRPEHFAYPYGYLSERVARVAGRRYRTCVTTELRSLHGRDRAERLPRLDSYYLQHEYLYSNPFSVGAQGYLKLRHLMRLVRQGCAR